MLSMSHLLLSTPLTPPYTWPSPICPLIMPLPSLTHPISQLHTPPSTMCSALLHTLPPSFIAAHPPGPTTTTLHGTVHHCLDSGHCRPGWCIYTGWALSLANLGIWAKTRIQCPRESLSCQHHNLYVVLLYSQINGTHVSSSLHVTFVRLVSHETSLFVTTIWRILHL